jgi:hypothetical protein
MMSVHIIEKINTNQLTSVNMVTEMAPKNMLDAMQA